MADYYAIMPVMALIAMVLATLLQLVLGWGCATLSTEGSMGIMFGGLFLFIATIFFAMPEIVSPQTQFLVFLTGFAGGAIRN